MVFRKSFYDDKFALSLIVLKFSLYLLDLSNH